MEGLEKEFDTYIKKTIKHTIINYAMKESKIREKEKSIEELKDNEVYTSLSFFSTIEEKTIVECSSNMKLTNILLKLTEKQKKILTLSIIDQYNSKEIAEELNLSDSRVRHILNDTLKEIRKKMEE